MEKKTKIIIGLLILLLLVISIPILLFGSVVMWQLGVFSPAEGGVSNSAGGGVSSPSGGGMNRATGLVAVKSFDRTIKYAENGTLSVVMTNARENTVTDAQLSFSEDCEGATYSISELASGENVGVSVDCKPKSRGDAFVATVDITYTEEVSGTYIRRKDSGRLTGTVG